MRIAARHPGWVTGLAAAFAGALALHPAAGLAAGDCLRLDQNLPGRYHLQGRFLPGAPTAAFCLFGSAGERVTVAVKPSANLDTEGYVEFAGTPPHGNWAPGGPGGTVFDEPLPWTGEYRLVIAQRFNEKKAGGFEIDITTAAGAAPAASSVSHPE